MFKYAPCSYGTKKSSHLKSHELTVHSELRPWECTNPGCTYAAKIRSDLTQHLKLHESNPDLSKPHCCTFKGYDYRAAKKAGVNRHFRRWHTLNRTWDFPCPICSTSFYGKSDLSAHIRSHVTERVTPSVFANWWPLDPRFASTLAHM